MNIYEAEILEEMADDEKTGEAKKNRRAFIENKMKRPHGNVSKKNISGSKKNAGRNYAMRRH